MSASTGRVRANSQHHHPITTHIRVPSSCGGSVSSARLWQMLRYMDLMRLATTWTQGNVCVCASVACRLTPLHRPKHPH